MAEVRHLGAERHNALCFAWRRLVQGAGSLDSLAAALGRQRSHLSEYGQPHSGRSPSVATVMEAEAQVGEVFVTAALAAAQGYRLVPSDAPGEAMALEPLAARVLAEMGEAFTLFAASAVGGAVTPTARARLEAEFGDVAQAANRMVAALRGAS